MVSTDSSEESLEETWSSKHVRVHLVNTIWDIISSYIILILILISSCGLENHSCFISLYFIVYHAVSWALLSPWTKSTILISHLGSALWRWRYISFLKACVDPPKRRVGLRATPAFVGFMLYTNEKTYPTQQRKQGNSSSKRCQKPGRGGNMICQPQFPGGIYTTNL